jgi:hypothetical protein
MWHYVAAPNAKWTGVDHHDIQVRASCRCRSAAEFAMAALLVRFHTAPPSGRTEALAPEEANHRPTRLTLVCVDLIILSCHRIP